jgi:hypothetical protein
MNGNPYGGRVKGVVPFTGSLCFKESNYSAVHFLMKTPSNYFILALPFGVSLCEAQQSTTGQFSVPPPRIQPDGE